MPERPSVCGPIVHLVPFVNGGTLLVWMVDVESLEVIQDEWGLSEGLNVVLDFLNLSWLWGSGGNWGGLLGCLWLSLADWLEWLGTHLDVAEDGSH